MRELKTGVLIALTLALTVATAGPAFATVQFTDSQSNSSPWWTPIGSTVNSSVTGKAASMSFIVPGAGAVTCAVQFSGYVPATHTQIRINDVQFRTCTSDMGTVSGVTTPVNSLTPWLLHVRTFVAPSASGTLNIPFNSPISIIRTMLGRSCDITLPAQSIRFSWTNATTSLVFNDATISYRGVSGNPLCPPMGTRLQVTSTFTVRPDTSADNLDVTLMSP
jgi:hypothetical protein